METLLGLPIRDTFDRADSDPIGVPYLTPFNPGIGGSGAVLLTSNAIGARSGNALWKGPEVGPDCGAFITLTDLPTPGGGDVVLLLRFINPTLASVTGYWCGFRNSAGTDRVRIIKVLTSSTDSGLIETDLGASFFAAGDRVGFTAVNGLLTAYRSAGGAAFTAITSVTDPSPYLNKGLMGFGKTPAATVLDDFGGGTLLKPILYWTRAKARRGRRFPTLAT